MTENAATHSPRLPATKLRRPLDVDPGIVSGFEQFSECVSSFLKQDAMLGPERGLNFGVVVTKFPSCDISSILVLAMDLCEIFCIHTEG